MTRHILIAKSTVHLSFLFLFVLGIMGGLLLDFRAKTDSAEEARRSLEETSIWEP